MRQVAVVGIGKTAFGAFPDRDLRSLAVEAGQKAMENASAPDQVEAFYLGNFAGPSFVGQNHLAPYVAGRMGITGCRHALRSGLRVERRGLFSCVVRRSPAGLYDMVLVGAWRR
jgi:acetyl-CoA C-acetyltransferase